MYRNKNSSNEDFEIIDALYKRIMGEDKALCTNSQKNLNAGVFVNGEMHPTMEKGPLHFQKLVRDVLQTHYEQEVEADEEIWPSRQVLPTKAQKSEKDVKFCSAVDCCSRSNKVDNRVSVNV